MSRELYMHFHSDEHPFVDRVQEWLSRSAQQHATRRTDFLDPRQVQIVDMLSSRYSGAAIHLDGGYSAAERKRAIITPDYRDPELEDSAIKVLAISSPDAKISQLEHGDYLGALLGLGIKREKIGDIHVHEQGCHVLIAEEISPYIDTQLRQVHRLHVLTELLPVVQLRTAEVQLEEMSFTVASLRLDGILSDVCRMSRAKIVVPIKAGRCKVNWKVEDNPAKPLKLGDVVSLQGFGRFKVMEVDDGLTKKGRIRLKIGKYS